MPLDPTTELAAYRAKYGPLADESEPIPAGTTHVLMVTDMSGSMAGLAEDVRGGFNTYVTDLASQPGRYRLTATLFDQRYMPLCVDADLPAVPKLTAGNYAPAGSTALLDAVGRTVGEFETRVTLAPADRVLVVVQTDGEENSSRDWTWTAIQKLIRDREATAQWSFVYLGAGADTWAQANRMGFASDGYVNTAATSAGTASTYSGLSRATAAYSKGATRGETVAVVAAEPGATNQI